MRKNKKIAVVEDEEALRRVLIECLGIEGYKVMGFSTGKEAVEHIPKFQPDIVLLDIILPEIDGFEVMNILKEDPRSAHIPIIVLTNLGDDESRKKALNAGARNFLVKAEFDLATIKKTIISIIGK